MEARWGVMLPGLSRGSRRARLQALALQPWASHVNLNQLSAEGQKSLFSLF